MAIADNNDTGGTRLLMAFLGLLSVIVGLFFLRHTVETMATLAFLIGLFWVIGGIIEFFSAYSDKGSPRPGVATGHGGLGIRRRHRHPGLPPPHRVHPGRDHGDLADHLRVLEIVLSLQLRHLADLTGHCSERPGARGGDGRPGRDPPGSGQRRRLEELV